jgi:hypothetical protein
MPCHAVHPIQNLFLESFSYVLNLICILYALLCGQNFILVKSGCYNKPLKFYKNTPVLFQKYILVPIILHLSP